jgi:hypothetical protein
VHRDVKPDNVLLEADRVWLVDFGIAATAQSAGQYTTGAIGTAQYMAPEQAQPGPIDGRADLYALGCVLYECWTGTPPYPGSDLATLLLAHAQNTVPTTGAEAMDRFMARAMAKRPEDRFPTGAEMMADLRTALAADGALDTGVAAPSGPGPAHPAARAEVSPTPPPASAAGAVGPGAARSPRRGRGRAVLWTGAAVLLVGALVAGALLLINATPAKTPQAGVVRRGTKLCNQYFCIVTAPGFSKNATFSNEAITALDHAGHPDELVKYGFLTQLTPTLTAPQVVEQVLIPQRLNLEGSSTNRCASQIVTSKKGTLASGYVCYPDPDGGRLLMGTYYEAETSPDGPGNALVLSVSDQFEVLPGAVEDHGVATMFESVTPVHPGSTRGF